MEIHKHILEIWNAIERLLNVCLVLAVLLAIQFLLQLWGSYTQSTQHGELKQRIEALEQKK